MYIPWGYYCWHMRASMVAEGAAPWGHLWSVLLLKHSLVDDYGNIFQAIVDFNSKHLQAQTSSFFVKRGVMLQTWTQSMRS